MRVFQVRTGFTGSRSFLPLTSLPARSNGRWYPYKAIPGRTMLFQVSGLEITALVLAQWINVGLSPASPTIRRALSKLAICSSTEGVSRISDDAKWVDKPSHTTCGDDVSLEHKAGRPSRPTPSLPMPVSTFK